jgi:hypothetical protein
VDWLQVALGRLILPPGGLGDVGPELGVHRPTVRPVMVVEKAKDDKRQYVFPRGAGRYGQWDGAGVRCERDRLTVVGQPA